MEEKRVDPRERVNGECDMKVLFTRREPRAMRVRRVKARVLNVSQGGLCLQTQEPFQEGDLADCEFRLHDGSQASSLGLVKWRDPYRGVGIEFFHGSEDERDATRDDVGQAMGGF